MSYHSQDFVYPENVGYPVGGPGEVYNMVIEMHYDNPNRAEGRDSDMHWQSQSAGLAIMT